MFPRVLPFNEIRSQEQQAAAGGKGGVLARLYQAGYPVPAGLVIFPEAFSQDRLLPEAWQRVVAWLSERRRRDDHLVFAVRSSGWNEDSVQASFAGEFETVLNVHQDDGIRQAIWTVYRSGQSERVQAYGAAQGIAADHRMAVIVQEMVPAAWSGVLFTADPVSGSHRRMVGHFVAGLGEKLVGGEASGERFKLRRPAGKYEGPRSLKRFGRHLFRMGRRLERELGGPQDIEFAIAHGRVHLLQARPITTLNSYSSTDGQWNDSRRGDYLWTNTNFGEAFPEVMTPFTWSIMQIYFEEAFPFSFPGNHPVAGNIGGRLYLNLSLTASMMAALKFDPRKLMREDDTFGRLPDDLELPIIPFSLGEAVRDILPLVIRARRRVGRLQAVISPFMADNREVSRRLRMQARQINSPAELASFWRDSLEPGVRQASQALFVSLSQLQNELGSVRPDLTKLVGKPAAGALLAEVDQGRESLESLGPLRGLVAVAEGEMSRQAYVELYGHRGPYEGEMAEPRPAEDPTWIDSQLAQIRESMERGEMDITALSAGRRAEYEAAWDLLVARHPRRAGKMGRRLDRVAEAGRLRESVRSEATRRLWTAREFALRAGELTGLGQDAFFLTWRELLALLAGDKSALVELPARREAYQKYQAIGPYPAIIRGRFDPLEWAADPERRLDIFDASRRFSKFDVEAETLITGFPGAAGIVEGRVRRLDRPEEGGQLLPGEILVTSTTNIGWTPLFPRAAAIVTDIGAPLSHAAIVARELGIPAVIGCSMATMRLNTGDRVRVDGGRGNVEILSSDTTGGEPADPAC